MSKATVFHWSIFFNKNIWKQPKFLLIGYSSNKFWYVQSENKNKNALSVLLCNVLRGIFSKKAKCRATWKKKAIWLKGDEKEMYMLEYVSNSYGRCTGNHSH